MLANRELSLRHIANTTLISSAHITTRTERGVVLLADVDPLMEETVIEAAVKVETMTQGTTEVPAGAEGQVDDRGDLAALAAKATAQTAEAVRAEVQEARLRQTSSPEPIWRRRMMPRQSY